MFTWITHTNTEQSYYMPICLHNPLAVMPYETRQNIFPDLLIGICSITHTVFAGRRPLRTAPNVISRAA